VIHVCSGTDRKARVAGDTLAQAGSVQKQGWRTAEEGKRLLESRRWRDGAENPDIPHQKRQGRAKIGDCHDIEAEATDACGADMRKRVGCTALLVTIVHRGVHLHGMHVQAIACMADHVRQRQLLPGQQLDQQPNYQQDPLP
jgi:hypothetical protein